MPVTSSMPPFWPGRLFSSLDRHLNSPRIVRVKDVVGIASQLFRLLELVELGSAANRKLGAGLRIGRTDRRLATNAKPGALLRVQRTDQFEPVRLLHPPEPFEKTKLEVGAVTASGPMSIVGIPPDATCRDQVLTAVLQPNSCVVPAWPCADADRPYLVDLQSRCILRRAGRLWRFSCAHQCDRRGRQQPPPCPHSPSWPAPSAAR